MFDWIGDVLDGLFGIVTDAISSALGNFFGKICYYAVSALLKIVQVVYQFFEVFSGGDTVVFQNSDRYLIDVFFGNSRINQVYWGMALIGFVVIVIVTIVAVIKKSFDIDGKEQRSLGVILLDAGRSGLTILLVSFAMTSVLNLTNTLIDRVGYLFGNAGSLHVPISMDFSDEQYSTMARIYNTIGNYSLNASYNSRYNLNSCYNDVREDLLLLQQQQVFDFSYPNSTGESWQSMLAKLDRAGDPSIEHSIEVYDACSATILEIMEMLKTNKAFYPLSRIVNEDASAMINENVPIDRIIFLMGTLSAARNSRYNQDPQITDGIRGAYYRGDKNIYSFGQVTDDFNTGLAGISYVIIALAAWFTLKNLFTCIFNCIARIFNLIGLYIIAPPIAGLKPLDNGGMFKQWIQATTIQMFSIFGCIIPMRLVILFIPMILDSSLVLFPNSITLNVTAKVVMIIASMEAAQRFSEVITGILAGNAGMAAIRSGDMSAKAGEAFSTVASAGAAIGGAALSGAGKMAKGVWDHSFVGSKVNGAAASVGDWASEKMAALSNYSNFAKKNGGLIAASSKYGDYRKSQIREKQEKELLHRRQERLKMVQLEKSEKELGLGAMEPVDKSHDYSEDDDD